MKIKDSIGSVATPERSVSEDRAGLIIPVEIDGEVKGQCECGICIKEPRMWMEIPENFCYISEVISLILDLYHFRTNIRLFFLGYYMPPTTPICVLQKSGVSIRVMPGANNMKMTKPQEEKREQTVGKTPVARKQVSVAKKAVAVGEDAPKVKGRKDSLEAGEIRSPSLQRTSKLKGYGKEKPLNGPKRKLFKSFLDSSFGTNSPLPLNLKEQKRKRSLKGVEATDPEIHLQAKRLRCSPATSLDCQSPSPNASRSLAKSVYSSGNSKENRSGCTHDWCTYDEGLHRK